MPTLSAMFRLFDGYSTQIDRMMRRTDAAMTKMLGASKAADGLNDSMKKTGLGADGAAKKQRHYNDTLGDTAAKAQRANSSLKTLLGTVASLAAMKKGMDLTDTYTNTNARLGMITSSPEEQAALRQDVFAAANRSRGDYTEMANAASKLRMLASDTFGGATGNQEAVAFTELLTKSLKVSGAGTAEQNSAFLQLTQAMTSGRLQGDEFRSVMENAPMVADAIAKYMGKSKAELRELSSEGLITADIIKGAMFSAADDINSKFESMPPTFADNWNRIKNAGTQAFGGVFSKINTILNSDGMQNALNNVIGLIYLAGEATEGFIDFCVAAWPMVSPLIWAAVAALGAYVIHQGVANGLSLLSTVRFGAQAVSLGIYALALWATTGATWAETTAMLGLNSALYACPIVWIAGLVLALVAVFYAGVAAVNHFAGTSISATGLIGAAFFSLGAFLYNNFAYPAWSMFANIANFIGNVFSSPVSAVKVLFYDMAISCINYALNIAKAIEAIVNKLPGAQRDIASGLEKIKTDLEAKVSVIKDESGWQEFVKPPETWDYTEMAAKGYNAGSGLADKASSLFSGFAPDPSGGGSGFDFNNLISEPYGGTGNPATVKGTGQGGAVKVENEEDIEWMRKLAERDYVARISQNTLAPNIRVEFSGPITKEADTDGVMSRVVEQLKDVIATAPEGVPA